MSECRLKATPHKDRLTPLYVICLHIFRHPAQKFLDIRQYACKISVQSDEKSDCASAAQSLCGVALKNGVLFIEQSKGNKDRNVVLSDDMLELMRKYWRRASEIVPINLYFFPDSQGGCIRTTTLNKVFIKYWKEADIGNSEKKTPRVYDFRHTFATKSLCSQIDKRIDINAFLPYLSAYMGHTHLSDTAYYVHLNSEFFPVIDHYAEHDFDDLLPEVDYE